MVEKVFVGSSALIGALERYAERLDFLELSTESNALPGARTLRRWRESVPATFQFSLVLPREVTALATSELPEAALAKTLEAARILAATFLVVRTPPSVTPSERGRRRIAELVRCLRPAGARIAWDTRGIWDPEDAEAFALEQDIVLVRDLAQNDPPDGPLVYTRLLSIGQQSRLGQAAIERVAERLADVEEAYVVVDGRGAPGFARRLRTELGLQVAEGQGDDDVAEDDDGDEPGDDEADESDESDEFDDEE